ncbi:MAG: hypothetical protein COA45_04795 [Zetaproteobacteria bacterium]|nr:MAG: hypothetical protein COA45_04795 [Zetaproteobacteria bacterium]
MLADFLSLEMFYGRVGAVFSIEEILERYGEKCVRSAINEGYLVKRTICIGPDCGRDLCWLSDMGRHMAM